MPVRAARNATREGKALQTFAYGGWNRKSASRWPFSCQQVTAVIWQSACTSPSRLPRGDPLGFVRREWRQLREHRLILLLLLTCAAVAYVVTQQADTVDQQRILIRILGDDSQQLHSSRLRDQISRTVRASRPRPRRTPENPALAAGHDLMSNPRRGRRSL